MCGEFYNYIATRIISYFEQECDNLRDGDRFILKLDNEDFVKNVNNALKDITNKKDIQGEFSYKGYQTFTIKLKNKEVIVAAQVEITFDFLCTLRNKALSVSKNPILSITYASNDTMSSATSDLTDKGMPFYSGKLFETIEKEIEESKLPKVQRVLLLHELERKKSDPNADQKSLLEYRGFVTALSTGKVSNSYKDFRLLPDEQELALISDQKKQIHRIDENHDDFEQIDQAFKFGNLKAELDNTFDDKLIKELVQKKNEGREWFEDLTYEDVKRSKENEEKKKGESLEIDNDLIVAYCGSQKEYEFPRDQKLFIRNGGSKKSQQRDKHILIYNPDKKETLTIAVPLNKTVRKDLIKAKDPDIEINIYSREKELRLQIKTKGCVFASVDIHDPSNPKTVFHLKICIVDLNPSYLENLQTCYKIEGSGKKRHIIAEGIKQSLAINPGAFKQREVFVKEKEAYHCEFDTTLTLKLNDDPGFSDNGKILFTLSCGSVQLPLGISDEKEKLTKLTGIGAFKLKNKYECGFEYRNGKIIRGTTPYYAEGTFRESLKCESFIVEKQALCVVKNPNGEYDSENIEISDEVKDAYINFLSIFKNRRQLPSLAYCDEDLRKAADSYVMAYQKFLSDIEEGDVLSPAHNNTLKLGVVFDSSRNSIAFSSVHPLNVMYQLEIRHELGLGKVRDDIVKRLTSANLLPYIKDDKSTIYEIVEQDELPEWKFYSAIHSDRFDEIRDFVPSLVAEKIKEYYAHFGFLFENIGDHRMILNLHNLGDCREIFLGIIQYFKDQIRRGNCNSDEILNFEVNIYSNKNYNDFSVLTNLQRTKEYLKSIDAKYEHNTDLSDMLVRKIRYFIRKEDDDTYRYSHIAFYQMLSSDKYSDSKISRLTTGASLNGIVSGVPSVLDEGWYKTGFGTKYASNSLLNGFAALLNSIYRVAYSSSTYTPDLCITTAVHNESNKQLDKVYSAANWVVFVDPKVDLSFFNQDEQSKDLLIIHYGDQNSSASGYNAITVTRKAEQYEHIIKEELAKKHIEADSIAVKRIIHFFNAINGRWLLRLIAAKKAFESTFSREKMSIISAIKFAMAYYAHNNIVWIPISLEELLRVSGNTGLSQNEGLLSAKNLSFDEGATCDDLLLIGIEKTEKGIYVYLHPVEVKIGRNEAGVIEKAKNQIINTHKNLLSALWPEGEERNTIERKVVRNFVMQLAILSCEKMEMYKIYPEGKWSRVLDEYREDLLNENYEISEAINKLIGIGTVISFKQGKSLIFSQRDSENNIAILQLPEQKGYEYLVKTSDEVVGEIESSESLTNKLSELYPSAQTKAEKDYEQGKEVQTEATKEIQDEESRDKTESQGKETEKESLEGLKKLDLVISESFDGRVDDTREISILFGQDQNTGRPLFWHPGNTDETFHTNTGIIGTMGTGKTQFTQSLVTQLYRERVNNVESSDIGILIFDYKGDYNESKENFVKATNAKILKPYHLPYNPFALTQPRVFKPLLPTHVANTFNDTLSHVYHLGPKQRTTLLNCIMNAYLSKGIDPGERETWTLPAPTFQDVYSLYMGDDDIKKGDSLEAALHKLAQFEVFEADGGNTKSLFDLLTGVVVIDISGYDPDLQNLIIAITLDLFYAQMQASGSSKLLGKHRQLTKMILVDEADNFLHEGFPSLKKILKEGREFGVGTILSTQFLKHFDNGDDDFSKYILTWVVHNVADLKNTDIRFVFNTEANSTEEAKLFGDVKKLQKHYSIVKMGNCQKPIYIKDKAFWELFDELQVQNDQ